jgi:hypothetical protein
MIDLQKVQTVLTAIQKQNNGVIPYDILVNLVNKFGSSLEELPLYILNDKKFEVKPGVIVHFRSNADNSVKLTDIHFNNHNVEFSYKEIHYGDMTFSSGTNQLIFGDNGIELVDEQNHYIDLTHLAGEEGFLAPAA